MSDELLVEDVEINLDESQIIGSEDGEVHESEEPDDGCSTTIIVDDGISTPENPGMMICTPSGCHFYIDYEDYPRISEFRWWVSGDGKGRRYVHTDIGGKKRYLHRLILRAPNGQWVDHLNGDALDNRKCNLRLATHQQNMFNKKKGCTYKGKPTSSSFKGVTWDKSRDSYKAQIMKNGVNHYLGHFLDERSAAMAYDQEATEMFGEFAHINFTYEDCEEGTRPSLGEDPRVDLSNLLAS